MPDHNDLTKPATIREVAARAGVSTATVSRSLRGGAGVEPATRKKVEAAARELRYRPSGVARSLKLRATSTLGLIVTDIENPYFPQIVSAVEDAARERGYSVLLADGRRDPERELESLDILAEREVDGMIIASTAVSQRHRERILELRCPAVIVNSESTVSSVPAVLSDNIMGGRIAAEHALELGHRALVFVGDDDDHNSAVQARIDGARAAVSERAGDGDRHFRAIASVGIGDGAVEGGIRAARELAAAAFEETAVLCRNDLTAIGVMRGLIDSGRRVPEDVSVVGYDDIELAAYVDPALSTVRQSTETMARLAVADLFERLGHGREPAEVDPDGPPGPTTRVPVELVARASSGPPPG
jgi:DNA-binding LacI/PurR family transcriptional regulator